jgi:hypothetical protein
VARFRDGLMTAIWQTDGRITVGAFTQHPGGSLGKSSPAPAICDPKWQSDGSAVSGVIHGADLSSSASYSSIEAQPLATRQVTDGDPAYVAPDPGDRRAHSPYGSRYRERPEGPMTTTEAVRPAAVHRRFASLRLTKEPVTAARHVAPS